MYASMTGTAERYQLSVVHYLDGYRIELIERS